MFLNLIPTRTIALILNSNRRATELPDEEIKTFRMERTLKVLLTIYVQAMLLRLRGDPEVAWPLRRPS